MMTKNRVREYFLNTVAIITGGASGIGRELALMLAGNGARVVIADIDTLGAREVADMICKRGGQSIPVTLDVTDRAAVSMLVQSTVSKYDRLDFMFNNAGIGAYGDASELTLAQWCQVIDVNFMGVVFGSHQAYAQMRQQGYGHIVNIASLAGLVPVPLTIPYTAAKHAVVALSQSLRAEASCFGVRVTVACPGPVQTNFYDSIQSQPLSKPFERPSAGSVTPCAAAQVILKGVARNRGTIVFPIRAQLTWLLFRYLPSIFERKMQQVVERRRH